MGTDDIGFPGPTRGRVTGKGVTDDRADAGTDADADAGTDAGAGAGAGAGTDAEVTDAGGAIGADAGTDVGADAVVIPSCGRDCTGRSAASTGLGALVRGTEGTDEPMHEAVSPAEFSGVLVMPPRLPARPTAPGASTWTFAQACG